MKRKPLYHLFVRAYNEDHVADAVAILDREEVNGAQERHEAKHRPYFEMVQIGTVKDGCTESIPHRGIWPYELYHVLVNQFGVKNVLIGYERKSYDQAYKEEAENIRNYYETADKAKRKASEKILQITEYDELYKGIRAAGFDHSQALPFIREITLNRIGDGLELIHADLQAIVAKIGADSASDLQSDLLAEQQEQM